jgi:hypothetical protein
LNLTIHNHISQSQERENEMSHNFHNIERLPGKVYYTGYATRLGAQVIYHIHNVKGISKPGINWRGHAVNSAVADLIYGKTLDEISTQLEAMK